MKNITLLPADSYIVYNKTVLNEKDKDNLINLELSIADLEIINNRLDKIKKKATTFC